MSGLVVTARIRVHDGMEERFEAAMKEVVDLTRAEPACLQYDLERSADHPHEYLLLERWRDRDGLERHLEEPYVRALSTHADEVLDGPIEVQVWEPSLEPVVHATEQLVVELFVAHLARSLSFYEHLGFRLLRREGGFAELAWESHRLFLDERAGLPRPERPQANVRVMVDDVDAYWARASALGAAVLEPIDDRYYGLRDFTILDPDGFGVRFGSRLPQPERR